MNIGNWLIVQIFLPFGAVSFFILWENLTVIQCQMIAFTDLLI